MKFNQIPEPRGLYDARFEHDACGVGFVCDIKGRKSRGIVEQSLEILRRMSHRGATGADPDSGDGAGILIQTPHDFLSAVAAEERIALPAPGLYAAGLFFFSPEQGRRGAHARIVEEECEAAGLGFLGWRQVPTRPEAIGKTARASMPLIRMGFFAAGQGIPAGEAFERRLYLARKRMENRVRALEAGESGLFYVVSLSSRTLVYKGMLTPTQVAEFFPDLTDKRMESAIALVHSRYSTNTFPSWDLAQPFRMLAHNGEINTLKGNSTWMAAREADLAHPDLPGLQDAFPVIQPGGSDSAALDNALELLMMGGRSLGQAMSMLVPAAWENDPSLPQAVRDFYRYQRCLMEPWDGPAALAFTDGIRIAAALDRNGLRPARFVQTRDGRIVMASEMGVLDLDAQDIERSGRLEPGKILFIDTEAARVVPDAELKKALSSTAPYGKWLMENLVTLPQTPDGDEPPYSDPILEAMNYTREELTMVLAPMANTGAEAVGSMGNDAPPAALSRKRQPAYHYFRQLFAQVTNPPIDPIREGCVMSLETAVGPSGNMMQEGPQLARRLVLEKPVFTDASLAAFKATRRSSIAEISLLFDPSGGEGAYAAALDRVCEEAEAAVRSGKGYLILTDRGISRHHAAVGALLASGAVHQHLTRLAIRSRCAIFVDSAEPREVMHFCVLFGFGADAVCPWGAYQALAKLVAEGDVPGPFSAVSLRYLDAVEHGMMKVLSKMGISALQSYKGAQIFEAIGIGPELMDKCFRGTPSRVGGCGLERFASEALAAHREAFGSDSSMPDPRPETGRILPSGGFYKWRRDGEAHAWNPDTIALLQQALRSGDYGKYKEYAALMESAKNGPINLRQLLRFKAGTPVPLDEVEPETEIVKRFATGAMSFGSISAPAHRNLALAMNRLGGKSNTGEGGEDPARFSPLPNGDSLNSKIKQVASGRFGVTTLYLSSAEEIQIKIAQGAKPGEGGQLPGHKVSEIIAKTRYTTPGVTLISPPPHHDIYSIEDLAQLILDLKNVNPSARISVKLVSEIGVGTVAAGVAKGKAEMILISGGDGGTGASPLSSIKHAGLPWELGLSETHQTLVMNGLRSRVRLQCDGGMRTGRDLAVACLMGAEEFGFATGPLIASGCVMLRHCHLNNCSMGVATQDERCAARFKGEPEHVMNYMLFAARQLREIMASLGFRTIDEMVGRVDMLEADPDAVGSCSAGLDFSRILWKPESDDMPRRNPAYVHPEMRQALDRKLIDLSAAAVDGGVSVKLKLPISNTDRCVGAQLSGHIMKKRGEQALPPASIDCVFTGTAGQSFGAWACKGLQFTLKGLANDYVGKGLFGATLAIRPPEDAHYRAEDNVILGNTALYGAISGELFARGRAGERFCVRNSGATAVVEGVGDHGCEYMTGGVALVIGPTGRNFGAGMSGGIAYVWDPDGDFARKFNDELADLEDVDEADKAAIRRLLERHRDLTGSTRAQALLEDFLQEASSFRKVMPRDYRKYLKSKGVI